jgi:hypothetical protein
MVLCGESKKLPSEYVYAYACDVKMVMVGEKIIREIGR